MHAHVSHRQQHPWCWRQPQRAPLEHSLVSGDHAGQCRVCDSQSPGLEWGSWNQSGRQSPPSSAECRPLGLWPAGGAASGHFLLRLIRLVVEVSGRVMEAPAWVGWGWVGFCCLASTWTRSHPAPRQAWLEALGHVSFGSCQRESQGSCCGDLPLPEVTLPHASPHPAPTKSVLAAPGAACVKIHGVEPFPAASAVAQ